MTQYDYIKDIARYALSNEYDHLIESLYALSEYAQQTKKTKFSLELQSIIKDSKHNRRILGTTHRLIQECSLNDVIVSSIMSDLSLSDLICTKKVREELAFFIQEKKSEVLFAQMNIPLSNKILLHGPSGCGKTMAAYVLAGELQCPITIVNLGAIVSSRLGETSKNLSAIFKNAATNRSIIFLDEFDTIGKIRDYDNDHGEMKRVVNTLLQLFDFYSNDCIVIAATNQIQMIDEALKRRFDSTILIDLPGAEEINQLIEKLLMATQFTFEDKEQAALVLHDCEGMSYYTIKKILLTAIKHSVLSSSIATDAKIIQTSFLKEQIQKEVKSK